VGSGFIKLLSQKADIREVVKALLETLSMDNDKR
jgi:hypothetical protein